ncbi:MAG: insulinase family protein [Bdellovibrionales bacterium]|nr:insulinase family protein [Bdellovibrionales bacterium]
MTNNTTSSQLHFRSTTLPNGLTVVGEQRLNAVSVALGFFVRTGARDESPEVAGVSHFLEHMMFKGTAKRSALDITYEMGAMGAQANAYTSEEATVYYMAVLPEYFRDALELLSDMLRPSLTLEEFTVEKKVILEEIALYQDRPTFLLFESAMNCFFGAHPAGNSVLGTTDTIGALSRDQMQTYFDARYSASNIVLCASGNFAWEELVDLAGEYCGNWPAVEASRNRPVHVPQPAERELTKKDLQRAHLCLVGRGPSATDAERYPLEVLGAILGDSSGSRTYWGLVESGLADSASIDGDDMDGAGMIYSYLSSTPELIDQAEEVLRKILRTPKEFTDDDLQRAITKLGTRLVLQGESSMRRLMAVGLDWMYRQEYVPLAEELARFKTVSRGSIYEALEKFPLEPTARVRMMPES